VINANVNADKVPIAILSLGVFNSPDRFAPAITPVNPGNNTVNIRNGELVV
jgi:hypothetical protein